VAKVEMKVVVQRGRSATTCVRSEGSVGHHLRFFLAAIWRDIPAKDLTRLAAKWGRPSTLLGSPGRGFGLWGPHG
jgi:hypothetical protein